MAVTFDSGADIAVGGTSTVVAVCSFTVAAGAVLLAGVNTFVNVSVSACTVNGTQMTQLGRIFQNGGVIVATIFGLTAPPAGVVSISAGIVGGAAQSMWIGGASYLGAKGTNPFGTLQAGSATGVASVAMSFSTSTTDRIVCFGSCGGVFSFSATEATTRLSDQAHIASRWVDAAGTGAAMSISCSTPTVGGFCFLGLNIAASVAAVTTTVPACALVGVGT